MRVLKRLLYDSMMGGLFIIAIQSLINSWFVSFDGLMSWLYIPISIGLGLIIDCVGSAIIYSNIEMVPYTFDREHNYFFNKIKINSIIPTYQSEFTQYKEYRILLTNVIAFFLILFIVEFADIHLRIDEGRDINISLTIICIVLLITPCIVSIILIRHKEKSLIDGLIYDKKIPDILQHSLVKRDPYFDRKSSFLSNSIGILSYLYSVLYLIGQIILNIIFDGKPNNHLYLYGMVLILVLWISHSFVIKRFMRRIEQDDYKLEKIVEYVSQPLGILGIVTIIFTLTIEVEKNIFYNWCIVIVVFILTIIMMLASRSRIKRQLDDINKDTVSVSINKSRPNSTLTSVDIDNHVEKKDESNMNRSFNDNNMKTIDANSVISYDIDLHVRIHINR